jgi:outer membrane cobalamin receptor
MIYQYSKDGELLNTFKNVDEACSTGANPNGIRMCIRGDLKTSHGFVWSKKKIEFNEVERKTSEMRKSLNYEHQFIESEISLFRTINRSKNRVSYEITCFKKTQVETLIQEIYKRFNGWKANWEYRQKDDVYAIRLIRGGL